jgi:DNA-binding ferritin-like protein
MGFWSTVGSFVSSAIDTVSDWLGGSSCDSGGGSSSSSSSYNTETIYEPDKVKVAELENERAEMLVREQKEIIELNARMQGAIIEAEAKSFEHSAEVLKNMMRDINIIAQQRMELLEDGHLEVVKKIENLYSDFEREIQKDNESFQLEKLPQMLEMLNKFPPESSSHKLYSNSVDKQINLNMEFVSRKLSDLSKRQNALIESAKETKKIVLEHSNKIVEDRMQFLEKQLEKRKELAIQNSQNQLEFQKGDGSLLIK